MGDRDNRGTVLQRNGLVAGLLRPELPTHQEIQEDMELTQFMSRKIAEFKLKEEKRFLEKYPDSVSTKQRIDGLEKFIKREIAKMATGKKVPMPDSNLPRQVRLERVEDGYRYDLGDRYRNGPCFEIQQIKQSGATFDDWWEIGIEGDDITFVLARSLTAVRRFLAAIPH